MADIVAGDGFPGTVIRAVRIRGDIVSRAADTLTIHRRNGDTAVRIVVERDGIVPPM